MSDEQRDERGRATARPVMRQRAIEEVVDARSSTTAPPPSGDGDGAADQVERDLDALGEAKRERDEYLELAQRTQADFENYRKRVAQRDRRGRARAARPSSRASCCR